MRVHFTTPAGSHADGAWAGRFSRYPLFAVLITLLCLIGCARGATLPAVTSGTAPVAGDGVSGDPVRGELRRLHVVCDGRREALIDDVDDARRRVRRVTGAAAVAWFVGGVLAGNENALAGGSDPTSARCDPAGGGGAGRSECGPRVPFMTRGDAAQSPAEQEQQSVELDAAAQVRAINRATDEVDMLLFASPNPEAWTETEQERWEQLHEVLLALCE